MTMRIAFTPKGDMKFLHVEGVGIEKLSPLVNITRWSNIEFNNQRQVWQVKKVGEDKVLFTNKSRKKCVIWEHAHFDALVKRGEIK